MTHYEILGIKETATQEEIKLAYKELIKKYHPDLNQGNTEYAERKSKEINIAYDVLSNSQSRKEYDLELHPETTTSYDYSNYSYTPPKYNNSYNSTYNSYYEQYKQKYSNDYSNTYNNYKKTASSDYDSGRKYNDYSNNAKNPPNPLLYDKLKYLSIIVIIYFALMAITITQFNNLFDNNKINDRETIISTNKKDKTNSHLQNESTSNTTLSNSSENTNTLRNDLLPKNAQNFNINDYFSDEYLYQIYVQNYLYKFENFSEFKKYAEYYYYYSLLNNR